MVQDVFPIVEYGKTHITHSSVNNRQSMESDLYSAVQCSTDSQFGNYLGCKYFRLEQLREGNIGDF